jgi:CheY-like chemotaxis protein/anti-sigma regulatory factor (Ser/Thr protein kinase)
LALDDVQKESLMEENLKEVYTAGLRAKDLVKQILAIARKTDENLKPIRIRSIAEETAKLLRATVPATIEMRLDLDTDALILGSPSQVHQIFMNLCTNAVHAMEETGGQLGIRVTDTVFSETVADSHIQVKPGEYILITISDTGAGIPPELIDTIFEPYVTTKAPGEGTGLGLAVVHGIVKTYGGEISIESTVGSGTVFSIYLPAIKGSESELPEPPEAPASGTEHILLVDDEPSVVQYVARSLERLGYTVSVKTTAKAALSLFESGPRDFDLIVTDMTMPQMTGEQLADAVKKIRPDMPVVLCTGYSKRISRLGEMPGSVDAILAKPVSRSDLAKTVRNMLDGKKGKE